MPQPPILTVSQLTRQIKDAVEGNFPIAWVLGEVTNCTRAGSGHVYLTLKDDSAQMRAVIWRNTAARLRFDVHDGLEVVAVGPVEVYEARGTYQLVVEQLLPQGIGALELAFRQLCEKLSAEGLFARERKRAVPRFPRRIALITSPTGAAVRDMLQVITRRWMAARIIIVPVAVQGEGAAAQIAAALRSVHLLPDVDVVITGRGGGSLEDLWAFNEEIVARAIHACRIPVVSAVGHEIDVTVADLVADVRALTPSEAGGTGRPESHRGACRIAPTRAASGAELALAGCHGPRAARYAGIAASAHSSRGKAARSGEADRRNGIAGSTCDWQPFEAGPATTGDRWRTAGCSQPAQGSRTGLFGDATFTIRRSRSVVRAGTARRRAGDIIANRPLEKSR